MRKFLLFLVLFISVEGFAQAGDSMKENRVEHKTVSGDSILIRSKKFEDSVLTTLPPSDSFQMNENNARNITALFEMQKKQRVKEKRGAIIRIGIGIALLIVLVIGLRRKTTKK